MELSEQEKAKLGQQYDKLASKFNELYLAGKERGRDAMAVALEKAREQMTAVGEFSAEHGEELKQYLARDLDQTIADAQKLGEEAKERLHPSRLGAGALASLATVLELTGNALHSLSAKTKEKLTYKTGEVTSAGTLTCQACGQAVHLKQTGHVPPCPKCSGTLFSKGY
jgi:isocitrate dehydrogenase